MHILFLCTGNSRRSQMAEGWLRHLADKQDGDTPIEVSSAGLEAHGLNPDALTVMASQGIDIGQQSSDIVTDAMLDNADLVPTIRDHADAHCPMVPAGSTRKLHIPFVDPAKAKGSDQEIQQCFLDVCLRIAEQHGAALAGN